MREGITLFLSLQNYDSLARKQIHGSDGFDADWIWHKGPIALNKICFIVIALIE